MESDINQPSIDNLCEYGGNYCDSTVNRSYSSTWLRSVKRKLNEFDHETQKFFVPGVLIPEIAKVEIENECGVLREMVTTQQQKIRDLSAELEQERNASSSAANEAMSMILRLQREKAEVQMDARQFKRFSEEKMAHDQQEIAAMEDRLYKREQTIQSLTCEVQAYKYRLMSYGLTESEAEGEKSVHSITGNSVSGSQFDFPAFDYPPLKCNSNENQAYPESENETIDIEKYSFNETPHSLKEIEQRINQLERSPRHSHNQPAYQPVLEKVIVGLSPRQQKPSSRFSTDSAGSYFATIKEELVLDSYVNSSFKKIDNASKFGDEVSDRIYTVDSIHYGASNFNDSKANNNKKKNIYDDFMSSSKDSMSHTNIEDPEVMKLYARLHALEADRESMKQALINMRTDKAQLVLLKEIAQHLCKEMQPPSRMSVKKSSAFRSFFIFSIFKWIASMVFWRRKARRSKYMNVSDPGLLVLLEKGPQVGQWRCLSRTQL